MATTPKETIAKPFETVYGRVITDDKTTLKDDKNYVVNETDDGSSRSVIVDVKRVGRLIVRGVNKSSDKSKRLSVTISGKQFECWMGDSPVIHFGTPGQFVVIFIVPKGSTRDGSLSLTFQELSDNWGLVGSKCQQCFRLQKSNDITAEKFSTAFQQDPDHVVGSCSTPDDHASHTIESLAALRPQIS